MLPFTTSQVKDGIQSHDLMLDLSEYVKKKDSVSKEQFEELSNAVDEKLDENDKFDINILSNYALENHSHSTINNDLTINGTLNGLKIGSSGNSLNKICIPSIDTSGVLDIGKYIDFHESHGSTCDYCARIEASNSEKCLKCKDSEGKQGLTLYLH